MTRHRLLVLAGPPAAFLVVVAAIVGSHATGHPGTVLTITAAALAGIGATAAARWLARRARPVAAAAAGVVAGAAALLAAAVALTGFAGWTGFAAAVTLTVVGLVFALVVVIALVAWAATSTIQANRR